MIRTFFNILFTILFLTPLVSIAGSEGLTKYLSTGFIVSNGNADLENSNEKSFSIPLILTLEYQRFNVSLATSYVGTDVDKAQGDTTLSLAYDLHESSGFTLVLKEKIATGDSDKGFSTGKNDTSLQLDYFSPVNINTALLGSLGYSQIGKHIPKNKNNTTNMKNAGYLSIGVSHLLSESSSLGALIDYQQSIFKTREDTQGISLFANRTLSADWSIAGLYAYDTLATHSFGITLTTQF